MDRKDADALNRALDDLADGAPLSGHALDPEMLATVRWLHRLGEQGSPDPRFSDRLEDELMNLASIAPRAGDVPDRRWSRRLAAPPLRLPAVKRATGALVWASWAAVAALVAFALTGPLQLWPDRSAEPPAVAPAVTLQPDDVVDLATHPIVGMWIPSANPPGPFTVEVFHADGTFTSVNAWSGTSVGVWRAVDDRSVEFVSYAPNRNLEPGVYREGQTILIGTATVDPDGLTYTGTFDVELSSTQGDPNLEVFGGTAMGTRVAFEDIASATPEA